MQAHGLGGTFTDGADLTGDQHKIVKMGAADNTVILADDNDEAYVGVVDKEPRVAGGAVGIQSLGIGRVIAGATVTRGALVQANALGLAIDHVPAAGTEFYLGQALEAAAVNEVFRVLINPGVTVGA